MILLIDDSPENCEYLEKRLGRDGYAVKSAYDGQLGLEILKTESIQLVLLDLEMPGMDGLSVLKLIREQYSAARLPVLMLSGRSDTVNKVEALERGADDFLSRPLEYPFLKAKLKQCLSRVPALESLEPGTYLAGYQLKKVLGQGNMGKVFLALDSRLDREVALKVLLDRQPSGVQRFLREARSLARVSHPNLPTIYEVGESPLPFISMQLIRGRELSGMRLGPAEAVELVISLADTVEAMHQQGMLHRDLKPANILLTDTGEVKIVDFGLAKMTGADDKLTLSGEVWGTPSYMAAEHFDDVYGVIDAASDVYSLAVILYELLSGSLPYPAGPIAALLKQILYERPPDLPRSVPAELREICMRGLERDKDRRYRNAATLAAELRSLELVAGT